MRHGTVELTLYKLSFVIFWCIAVSMLQACRGTAMPLGPFVWPKAPDTPRFIYETTLFAAENLQLDDVTRLERFTTSQVPKKIATNVLYKPYAVAAKRGMIYVSDTARALVHVWDVPRRRYFVLGVRFEGKLHKPAGMDLDQQGRLYVADIQARTVMIYDAWGLYQARIGAKDALAHPVDVAVNRDATKIFVLDRGDLAGRQHGIIAYDSEGRRVKARLQRGHGSGEFNLPVALKIGPDALLYVLDAGNFRVQIFNQDLEWQRSFGKLGTSNASFARPRDLAIDVRGSIYISDAAFGNVQIFSPDGVLYMHIGGDLRGRNWPGAYPLIAGIDVDETGRIYVAEQFYRKLEILRPWQIGDPVP